MHKIYSILLILIILLLNLALAKKIDPKNSSVCVVSIGKEIWSCTGVIIKETPQITKVLTAKHCVVDTEIIYVNNNLVIFTITSNNDDLALLYVEGKIEGKKPIIFAKKKSKLLKTIYHIGYPKCELYESQGLILETTKDSQYARMEIKPGCSGGGVFNKKGQLIGSIWAASFKYNIAVFEPISDIKKFLKEIGE